MKEIKNYIYSEITESLISECKQDLIRLYQDINYIKDGLPQQTLNILFNDTSPVWNHNWKILRDTFMSSMYCYTNSDYANYKAWTYTCFPKTEALHTNWHNHPNSRYSGILYISLPNGANTTEFMCDETNTIFLPNCVGSWFIFDSTAVHRPGAWDSNINDYRFCLWVEF